MSIYNVDMSDVGVKLSPPNKRHPKMMSWIAVLLTPLQWIIDIVRDYKFGSIAPVYDNAITYPKGNKVRYTNRIYEAKESTTGNAPTNQTYWRLVIDDFRGTVQRVKFNGQLLVLEFILNQWFDTNFVQPNEDEDPSEIYIVNNKTDDNSALVGEDSGFWVGEHDYLADDFVGEDYNPVAAHFTVYYPSALTPRLDEMKALVNKGYVYERHCKQDNPRRTAI